MRKLWVTLCAATCAMMVAAAPASAFKVVVDAGHGGRDPGAVSAGGLQEKYVNLDIAQRLKNELLSRGYEVSMTRDSDVYLSLAERVEFTNEQNADIFVSVHANSHPSSSAKGSMVLYYDAAYPQNDYPSSAEMTAWSDVSKLLAQQTLDGVVRSAGTENDGLVPSAVYVVRMGTIPSVLVETAFLSNRSDAALLADASVRQSMAEGIAKGIAEYAALPFPDITNHWAKSSIMRLKEKGIVNGINHYFYPDKPLTRAQFAAILDRAFHFEEPKPGQSGVCPKPAETAKQTAANVSVTGSVYGGECSPVPASFRDLPATYWAYETLMKAAKLRYMDGYADGTIRPDQPITRAEAAALLDRIVGSKLPAATSGFDDVADTMWAAKAIGRLHAAGIVGGVADNLFAPSRTITRGEISAMMDRYLSR
ncbi:N-acetylmuramoyl-L-alanine amidase [Paenibacillus sp. MBLB4367]|uniref:N-acetylmuramoyl-L-alanine amidase n=1 Tax=Paenibacillus sp. MBLB4367 TaxID=3384767 RepID=UPI003908392F